jgi:hypothetical protein
MIRHGPAHRRPRSRRPPMWGLVSVATVLSLIVVAVPAQAAVGVPVTYDDFSYASAVTRPSENKPQSKLWYTDGSWWALMVSPGSNAVHIFQLMTDHTWRDTGTTVDTRLNSTGDALWTAADSKLTVVSRDSTAGPRIARFSYNSTSNSYAMDPGFPISISTGGGSESATIDRDSTGRLWITYTRLSKLWVAHSDPSGLAWTAGYNPAVPDVAIKSDDISSVIAFNGRIGVMWSDQASHAFRFAIHRDGDPDQAWTVENALAGTNLADDHINLKQVANDAQGRIFAAIKTSQDAAGPTATLVGVLVRTPRSDGTGDWSLVPAGTVADDHTRPIIMIDQTNQELYFFATAPVTGGDIYYKKTSLANPVFGAGRGQKFVDSAAQVNNASGAKDPVTSQTGMVILAVAEGRKRYVHAEMQLAGSQPPPPPSDIEAPSTPQGLSAAASAGKVDLAWGASSDDVGVAGYAVRRDGQVIADVPQTSYTDTAVAPGNTYSYTVQARDAVGHLSGESTPASATVPASPPPGEGISLRGATTARNNAEATITLPVPANQPGDLMLASVDFRGQPTITAPAGWQLLRLDVNGTAMRKATYWRLAAAAEAANYTWRFSAKPSAVGSMLSWAGVSGSSPIDAAAAQVTEKSTSVTAPSVTTTSLGTVVVGLYGVARAATLDNPAGAAELTEVTSPAGAAFPMTGESSSEVSAVAGPTGPRVARSSVAGPNIGQLVALRPA